MTEKTVWKGGLAPASLLWYWIIGGALILTILLSPFGAFIILLGIVKMSRWKYEVTNERVKVVEGLLGKERYDVELVRIQDLDHKQNLTERTLNIGDVFIRSHDPGKPELTLHNISNPAEVHEILRRAMLKARKKYNLSYREEM